MADTPPQCVGCGRFCDVEKAHFAYTPLNEFGPEEIEWICPECKEPDRKGLVDHG